MTIVATQSWTGAGNQSGHCHGGGVGRLPNLSLRGRPGCTVELTPLPALGSSPALPSLSWHPAHLSGSGNAGDPFIYPRPGPSSNPPFPHLHLRLPDSSKLPPPPPLPPFAGAAAGAESFLAPLLRGPYYMACTHFPETKSPSACPEGLLALSALWPSFVSLPDCQ